MQTAPKHKKTTTGTHQSHTSKHQHTITTRHANTQASKHKHAHTQAHTNAHNTHKDKANTQAKYTKHTHTHKRMGTREANTNLVNAFPSAREYRSLQHQLLLIVSWASVHRQQTRWSNSPQGLYIFSQYVVCDIPTSVGLGNIYMLL